MALRQELLQKWQKLQRLKALRQKLQKMRNKLLEPKTTGKDLRDFLNNIQPKNWQKGTKYKFCMLKDRNQLPFSIRFNPSLNQSQKRLVTFRYIMPTWRVLLLNKWEKDFSESSWQKIMKEKPDFSIEANPTQHQPGNGLVTFGPNDSINPKWRDLVRAVLDPQFPSEREKFLKTCLKGANFNKKSTQANVLLLFEVARRRPDEKFFARISKYETIQPIYTRKNAKDAIKAVMGIRNDDKAYTKWVSWIRGDNAFKILFIPFCIYDGLKFNRGANCRFQCIDLLLSRLLLCRDHIMAC